MFGEFRDLGDGLRAILPHEEMSIIREGRKEGWIFRVHLISEARQLKFTDDPVLEQAGEVGRGRDAITGPDFFRYRAAAHQLTFFQHQHFAAGPREVSRGDQSVVSRADDDYVVFSQLTIVAPLARRNSDAPRRP